MDIIIASFIEEVIVPKFNYWIYVILMMIGMYAMITKNNLIKKLIGMAIFQTAIILLYVSVGVKSEANIPIICVTYEVSPLVNGTISVPHIPANK